LIVHPDDVDDFFDTIEKQQENEIVVVSELNMDGNGTRLHGQTGGSIAALFSFMAPAMMPILKALGTGALTGSMSALVKNLLSSKKSNQKGGLRFLPPKNEMEAEQQRIITEKWKNGQKMIGKGKTDYYAWHANLSESQKETIKNAITNKIGATITLSKDKIRGEDLILVTKDQLKRLENSSNANKGIKLNFSKTQLQAIKSQKGGFLHLLPLLFLGKKLIGKGEVSQPSLVEGSKVDEQDEVKKKVMEILNSHHSEKSQKSQRK
jgi:hypothetical protein